MPLKIRTDDEISDVEGGWFRARWHYSFDSYVDPEYTRFGTMRVFNDDRLVPGAVWPMHPHRDIEGLTYVVAGMFRHEDDVGGSPGPLPAGSESVPVVTRAEPRTYANPNGSCSETRTAVSVLSERFATRIVHSARSPHSTSGRAAACSTNSAIEPAASTGTSTAMGASESAVANVPPYEPAASVSRAAGSAPAPMREGKLHASGGDTSRR